MKAIFTLILLFTFTLSSVEWNTFKESYIDQQLSLSEEFDLLEEFSLLQLSRQRPFNPEIDRHPEWVPFNENKVTLNDLTDVSACYIHVNQDIDFIAAQAPQESNIDIFWQMVWEKNIDQIVMTTELLGNEGGEACTAYWPNELSTLQLKNGLLTLLEDSWLTPDIQIRKFKISHQNESRTVTHYWYHNWPNEGIPNGFESITALAMQVKKDKISTSPILAHCAAGVGRTGIFITVYTRLNTGPLNLFDFIGNLRWQRPDMVGSFNQYEYCHQFNNL